MGLSILIAIQGSFVSLVLAREVDRFEGLRRRLVLGASAVTLGSSIWAMHFIGMLAYHMPMEAGYDPFLTLLSFFLAVLVVGIGYGVMTLLPTSAAHDGAAAIFTGGGIAGMHYVGMSALTGPLHLGYQAGWVAASIVIGIVAAGISLHLAFGTKLQARSALGAVAMGLAISGMHYSAMAGTIIMPTTEAVTADGAVLDRGLLALIVAVVAFVLCAASMLLLVPTVSLRRSADSGRGPDGSNTLPAWIEGTVPAADGVAPGIKEAARPADTTRVPVLSGTATLLLEQGQIHSIRADGRYTHLHDGSREYFCNLSITDLDSRLGPDLFLRVHRSHIVQVRHVHSFRRRAMGPSFRLAIRSPWTYPSAGGR
jgi:NO-binding membrane sensor protein with MHYT domain